ncbi:hypothetical protein ACTI_70490 [Actinoplanes sp. OR16]|nr:hypothetical protein ACTI_70490 [Actinoplanes sp. OR16]
MPATLLLAFAAACTENASGAKPGWTTCADPANDDGHCDLQRKDVHQRTVVPSQAIGGSASAVHDVVDESRFAATASDVAAVTDVLDEAGYEDHVVRLARDSDPTAIGSLIYAVKVGDVCVLGDVTPADRSHEWFAGVLPDGSCLVP